VARTLKHFTTEEMQALHERYGEPKRLRYKTPFLQFECELVRESRDKGQLNDVTCFIRRDENDYVVIQKHQYAHSGIYRAPSGGVKVSESIEAGAIREMKEETGLTVRLLRMVLDLSLDVVCDEEIIPWRSFVFLAEPISGEMKPIDTHEIFDVAVLSRDMLLGDIDRLMTESGWGGFAYRAFLTREFFKQLDELAV
jgi:8-oxo-dGTP pyrophosphatase MutT (NUDIX family)